MIVLLRPSGLLGSVESAEFMLAVVPSHDVCTKLKVASPVSRDIATPVFGVIDHVLGACCALVGSVAIIRQMASHKLCLIFIFYLLSFQKWKPAINDTSELW